MKVLLLCNYEPYNAATVCDHINAFPLYSSNEVVVYSGLVSRGGNLPEDFPLDDFDAVILHYSLFLAINAYVSPSTRRKLKGYRGVKAIFLQDEYRFVNASARLIADTGFDIIFTCVPPEAIDIVYPSSTLPGVDRINVLTGYVPEALLNYQPKPLSKRRFDVSYRGRKYPLWHGRLGLEKWTIADRFKSDAQRYNLKCDISYRENDRLYGRDWVELLQNSKAVLGVESGASIFDFTGELSDTIQTIETLLGEKTSYESLREEFFAHLEDVIPLAQISPRVFEAIALRSLCILYEGEYSGVLKPWRHYVPLKKDHSNMDEVVAVLRDPVRMTRIIALAYSEVGKNPNLSYSAFISRVDTILESRHKRLGTEVVNRTGRSADEIQRNYPFCMISDPHGLRVPRVRRFLTLHTKTLLANYLPQHVKLIIKRLIGRDTQKGTNE